MLRVWQSECIDLALQKFSQNNQHFLCQATPGAGKTIMAAFLAKELFDRDEVDLVLCFSPSLVVSEGIKNTFSQTLDCSFNGGLGTKGASYTYQAIRFLDKEFWDVISKHRVLVVFDEIHHCSADESGRSNVWGEQIVTKIQHLAKYSLALSGTPWRSDSVPIVMAEYTDPEGHIVCDYQYGLRQAVNEGVCRAPKIVLIDNDNLSLTEGSETKSYSSIFELLKQSKTSYQSVIHNSDAMDYLLESGCKKLDEIRAESPNAAGLVVAASVRHAALIQQKLEQKFGQTTCKVTYHDEKPLEIINEFRTSNTQWIVSVGMISEGTDIPRLQVCCHMSSVKTELYFRQVLGRILRVNDAPNQEAWLYTFAEANLVTFAERIEQAIPESLIYRTFELDNDENKKPNNTNKLLPNSEQEGAALDINRGGWLVSELAATGTGSNIGNFNLDELRLGRFKHRVISAFT
jgi:superfamily II DNA or RNA helicase